MSEYSRAYCPVCKKRTDHEDGACMDCLERDCRIWSAIQADGIDEGSIVLARDLDTTWQLAIFTDLEMTENKPFQENLKHQKRNFELIALWDGDSDAIGTTQLLPKTWGFCRLSDYL